MNNLRNISLILVFIIILTGLVFAQSNPVTSKSDSSEKNKPNFVSLEGGFTINLPTSINGFSAPKPISGVSKNERQYTWRTNGGLFMISFFEFYKKPENSKSFLENRAGQLIQQITDVGGKLMSARGLTLDGHPGYEVIMSLSNRRSIGVTRYYIINNKGYTLTTGWGEGVNGQEHIKILDSFKLIDAKPIIDQKIAAAIPKPLPQTPVATKLKSDAEDDNIKGKVKTVTEETEDLSLTWNYQGRHLSSITDYDDKGNQIKRISYDSKALPSEITVYGYIEGKRVLYSNAIESDENPKILAPAMVGNTPREQKTRDLRFDFSFEYKYVDGKLAEEKWIQNDGSLWMTYVYNYKGNQLEQIVYDENEKINQKYISILDNKGNVIEKIDVAVLDYRKVEGDRKYSIEYQSFDEKGNWTKRTRSKVVVEKEKEVLTPVYTEYRTIVYFP